VCAAVRRIAGSGTSGDTEQPSQEAPKNIRPQPIDE